MSIIVKGMRIPECCRECPFENYNSYTGQTFCNASLRVLAIGFGVISFDGRHSSCPLVALPEKHGRLVDADAIVNAMNDMNVGGEVFVTAVEYVKLIMNDADTIIEAEDSADGI